jgi:hypothetical protein
MSEYGFVNSVLSLSAEEKDLPLQQADYERFLLGPITALILFYKSMFLLADADEVYRLHNFRPEIVRNCVAMLTDPQFHAIRTITITLIKGANTEIGEAIESACRFTDLMDSEQRDSAFRWWSTSSSTCQLFRDLCVNRNEVYNQYVLPYLTSHGGSTELYYLKLHLRHQFAVNK